MEKLDLTKPFNHDNSISGTSAYGLTSAYSPYTETLLFSADRSTRTTAVQLDDLASNYERIRIEVNQNIGPNYDGTGFGTNIIETVYITTGSQRLPINYGGDIGWYCDALVCNWTSPSSFDVNGSKALTGAWQTTAVLGQTTLYKAGNRQCVSRVWGVNKK